MAADLPLQHPHSDIVAVLLYDDNEAYSLLAKYIVAVLNGNDSKSVIVWREHERASVDGILNNIAGSAFAKVVGCDQLVLRATENSSLVPPDKIVVQYSIEDPAQLSTWHRVLVDSFNEGPDRVRAKELFTEPPTAPTVQGKNRVCLRLVIPALAPQNLAVFSTNAPCIRSSPHGVQVRDVQGFLRGVGHLTWKDVRPSLNKETSIVVNGGIAQDEIDAGTVITEHAHTDNKMSERILFDDDAQAHTENNLNDSVHSMLNTTVDCTVYSGVHDSGAVIGLGARSVSKILETMATCANDWFQGVFPPLPPSSVTITAHKVRPALGQGAPTEASRHDWLCSTRPMNAKDALKGLVQLRGRAHVLAIKQDNQETKFWILVHRSDVPTSVSASDVSLDSLPDRFTIVSDDERQGEFYIVVRSTEDDETYLRVIPRFVFSMAVTVPSYLLGRFFRAGAPDKKKNLAALHLDSATRLVEPLSALSMYLRLRYPDQLNYNNLRSDVSLRIAIGPSPDSIAHQFPDVRFDLRIEIHEDSDLFLQMARVGILKTTSPHRPISLVVDASQHKCVQFAFSFPSSSLHTVLLMVPFDTAMSPKFVENVRHYLKPEIFCNLLVYDFEQPAKPSTPAGQRTDDHVIPPATYEASQLPFAELVTTIDAEPFRDIQGHLEAWLLGRDRPRWVLFSSGAVPRLEHTDTVVRTLLRYLKMNTPLPELILRKPSEGCGASTTLAHVAYEICTEATVFFLVGPAPTEPEAVGTAWTTMRSVADNRNQKLVLFVDEDYRDSFTSFAAASRNLDPERFVSDMVISVESSFKSARLDRAKENKVDYIDLNPYVSNRGLNAVRVTFENALPAHRSSAIRAASDQARACGSTDFDRHLMIFTLAATRGQYERAHAFAQRHVALAQASIYSKGMLSLLRLLAFISVFSAEAKHRQIDLGHYATLLTSSDALNRLEEARNQVIINLRYVVVPGIASGTIRLAHPFIGRLLLEHLPTPNLKMSGPLTDISPVADATTLLSTLVELQLSLISRTDTEVFVRRMLTDRVKGAAFTPFICWIILRARAGGADADKNLEALCAHTVKTATLQEGFALILRSRVCRYLAALSPDIAERAVSLAYKACTWFELNDRKYVFLAENNLAQALGYHAGLTKNTGDYNECVSILAKLFVNASRDDVRKRTWQQGVRFAGSEEAFRAAVDRKRASPTDLIQPLDDDIIDDEQVLPSDDWLDS